MLAIDLSKTSTGLKNKLQITINIEENLKQKPCCPQCKFDDFEGFSTSYGPFRRCKKCAYEWAIGGNPAYFMLDKEEKEMLKERHNAVFQDDAYNKAFSNAEDLEHLLDVQREEQLSGSVSNRAFWNRYMSQWGDEFLEE